MRRLVKPPTPGILQVGDRLVSRYKGSRERCTHGYCISRTPSSIPGINIVAFAVAEYDETLCLSDYIFVRVSAISRLLQASLSFFLIFHMAAMFARRPILTTAAATAVVGTALYMSRPAPLRLDSAYREPSKTLSFPRSMLLSRELKVKQIEQVNHDTKRITFELPGGETEISGVPASCMQIGRDISLHCHQLTLSSRHSHSTHTTRRMVSSFAPLHPYLTT